MNNFSGSNSNDDIYKSSNKMPTTVEMANNIEETEKMMDLQRRSIG